MGLRARAPPAAQRLDEVSSARSAPSASATSGPGPRRPRSGPNRTRAARRGLPQHQRRGHPDPGDPAAARAAARARGPGAAGGRAHRATGDGRAAPAVRRPSRQRRRSLAGPPTGARPARAADRATRAAGLNVELELEGERPPSRPVSTSPPTGSSRGAHKHDQARSGAHATVRVRSVGCAGAAGRGRRPWRLEHKQRGGPRADRHARARSALRRHARDGRAAQRRLPRRRPAVVNPAGAG